MGDLRQAQDERDGGGRTGLTSDGRLEIGEGAIEAEALAAYRDGFDIRVALDLSLAISLKRLAAAATNFDRGCVDVEMLSGAGNEG